MDAVVIILAVMGCASAVLALFILTDSRRTFREDAEMRGWGNGARGAASHHFRERSTNDRRSGRAVHFPLMVNGELVLEDRRKLPDRRQQPALA